jgi:hypothetical protein
LLFEASLKRFDVVRRSIGPSSLRQVNEELPRGFAQYAALRDVLREEGGVPAFPLAALDGDCGIRKSFAVFVAESRPDLLKV